MPKTEPQGALYRLILGDLAHAPERVRARMLATIPTTPLSLLFYSLTLLAICTTTVYVARAPWAWAWLAVSIVVVAWRALHPLIEKRRGRPLPLASIMCSSGLALASFGFGCAQSVATGNLSLTLMAFSGTIGVLAGVATRWAALPRPAMAVMVLSVLPPIVVLTAQGGTMIMTALILALVTVSVIAFTLHNQETLLAAITAEELLRRKAQTDHLTGLANRAALMEQMADACELLPELDESRGHRFAVLYIDLDGFKAINDSLGHAAGDEVLQRVAHCLMQAVSPEEVIARIGGDEFVVLLADADALTARAVAEEIIATISRDHRLTDGRVARLGCSVGISMAPDQGSEPEVLLARADAALYEVKNQGKGHTGVWRALGEA